MPDAALCYVLQSLSKIVNRPSCWAQMLLKIHSPCSHSFSTSTHKIVLPPTLGFLWCHCMMSAKYSTQYSLFHLRTLEFLQAVLPRLLQQQIITKNILPAEWCDFIHLLNVFPWWVAELVPPQQTRTVRVTCDLWLEVKHKCTDTQIPYDIIWMLY